jgi:hypothetical protein
MVHVSPGSGNGTVTGCVAPALARVRVLAGPAVLARRAHDGAAVAT